MKESGAGFELLAEFKPTDYTAKDGEAEAAVNKATALGGNSGPETLGIITATNACYGVNIVR